MVSGFVVIQITTIYDQIIYLSYFFVLTKYIRMPVFAEVIIGSQPVLLHQYPVIFIVYD